MKDNSSKYRIKKVAEDLFSKNGFDGTSVDSIAKKANVNKALIYYYFENKDDILLSIFQNVQEELIEHLKSGSGDSNLIDTRDKLKKEIEYLKTKKKVIALILMESFKENRGDFLFKSAEIAIEDELNVNIKNNFKESESEKFLMNEFFTGFIPILTFIAYEDKWCHYFKCRKEKAVDYFLDVFMHSHYK